MDAVTQFELLSDAARLALLGGAFWLVAALATVMERRRGRAREMARLEAVGWVPWTTVFVLCATAGAGLLAMSLPAVLKG
jgi:hypothetical protein